MSDQFDIQLCCAVFCATWERRYLVLELCNMPHISSFHSFSKNSSLYSRVFPMSQPFPEDAPKDKQKKPRHRHSPEQLAALNRLFEQNEHPSLDIRSSLAERLGMETKTVNAWFQNKRASSKRRTRGVSYEQPPINSFPESSSSTSMRHPSEMDDFYEDDYGFLGNKPSSSASVVHADSQLSNFSSIHPDLCLDANTKLRRSLIGFREAEQLRSVYMNAGSDQRQHPVEHGGINKLHQSISNWFQNQRDFTGTRNHDERPDEPAVSTLTSEYHRGTWKKSIHSSSINCVSPSRSLYPSTSSSRFRRSPSISPSLDGRMSRRSSTNPYGNLSSVRRPRRSRPEPYQLDALKDLFLKTETPSIDERNALALEIGMDVGRITNWFRNLRQTARRRRKRTRSADDEDDDGSRRVTDSASASRSGTPSFRSSSSLSSMDLDGDDDYMHETHSDVGSEDEYQEAVTPPPEQVHTPPVTSVPPSSSSSRISISQLTLSMDPASYAELEKVSATHYSGVKIEDALLLLSFHHHVTH